MKLRIVSSLSAPSTSPARQREGMTMLPMVVTLFMLVGVASSFTVSVNLHSSTVQQVVLSPSTKTKNRNSNEAFQLFGRKKKGNLVLGGDDYDLRSSMLGTKTKTNVNKKSKKAQAQAQQKKESNKVVKVSSSLSEWAATQNFDSTAEDTTTATGSESTTAATTTTTSSDDSVEYTSFDEQTTSKSKKNKSNNKTRRERDAKLQKQNKAYTQKTNEIITDLKDIISSNNFDVQSLLSLIDSLIVHSNSNSNDNDDESDSVSSSIKQLFKKNNAQKISSSSSSSSDYTLAWVGSDDAICHLGTGLHKVPLARLQDIFVTLGNSAYINDGDIGGSNDVMASMGKSGIKNKKKSKAKAANLNSITVMEVIRILGPFPNVRNTLQGKIEISTGSGSDSSKMGIQEQQQQRIMKRQLGGTGTGVGQDVQITYNSMMDGLGKEIQAGNDGDVRSLGLTILFADDDAIVAVVPPNKDEGDDNYNSIYGPNGENVLLFLKESDLDGKLNGLRAS